MDARDSSPSSTTARNASPATTDSDDAVSNVTVSLAKDAASHFQSSKFAECVEVLNQLLHNNKQHDPKVLHNIAIAEHFRDDCSDPKKLLELLSGIKKKSDELALASVEQEESVNSMGNKVVLGSQGRNDLEHHFSGANSITMYTDEFNSSVATLNIAIIWFHLHDYAKTLAVLEPLFQNIEPINETIALHICLLLLDASLACHDASKSADVLAYLEKALGVGNVSQGDNGNTTQEKSTNQITKSSSVPNSASIADASNLDLEPSADASENNLSGALSDDSLDYEAVLLGMGRQRLGRLPIKKRSLRRPLGPSPNDILKALVGRFSTFDLKLRLQLYKVRFLLLTRNLKLAKREVKLVMNIAHGRDLSMALLLKSQLEYARGNHHKAIKLLMASSNSTDAEFSSMFNNNLGCIYFQLGKLQTSSLFFTKALTNISSVRKDQPLKLATFSRDNSLLIIYNSGLQYLLCKKPIHAAHCFQKASLILYRQPLLWLRLSECCLMALENGLIKSSRAPSEISEVDVCVVGNGKWRQLVVEDQGPRNGHMESYRSGDCCLSNDGQLKLSMSLARQCLLNVLLLLDSCSAECLQSGLLPNSLVEETDSSEVLSSKTSNHKNIHGIDSKSFSVAVGLAQVNSNMDTKEQKGGTSKQLIQNSLSYYEGTCRKENQLIKQAVLANLAYVELELDNPVKALLVARLLLEIPECSRIYVFLGHVYAAEALCLLNRPKEAAEHLSFYLSGVNTVELPFISEDIEKWQMESTCEFEEANRGSTTANNSSLEGTQRIVFIKPEEARATIYANFAAMSARQGDLARAQILITEALSISPNCPEATLTAVFVDLLLGKSQEALAKLKHCSRIRFLPSGIALKKSS
ncbi:hypothetical protein TanjilG_14841 [Lupinus angustifolius]|uniref:Uncharacterized protein n=1 Tax=Lupinus angustifolius TaxID=3871 RepID=A0A1J7H948_LUPAN|nr:PREDICTED: CCR4-NOT transcription complex subunit 10-like isoform X2 [Lupinus angustifolius]OIV98252.1 hypothetical protein TanjilG_14841 [Lupinus angustifolius]